MTNFDKLPTELQSDIEQAIKVVLKDEEPEMASMFRELVAEKYLQEPVSLNLDKVKYILTNFMAGWKAHETVMFEMMKVAAETKQSDPTMMFPMLPNPLLKKQSRRPF